MINPFNFFRRACVVLLYHRVTELKDQMIPLAVSPKTFESQMQFLRGHYEILTLGELVTRAADRTLGRRSVAVTFDDGYADNYLEAKPILEKCKVPATMFITTGMLGSGREFWWDELEKILQASARSREDRLKAFQEISLSLKPLQKEAIGEALKKLRSEARVREETGRPTHRALSAKELIELAKSEWIEIGAHSENHLSLSSLNDDAQKQEITNSKKKLENLLEREIRAFAYPFGRPDRHYLPQTVRWVKEAGFSYACSTDPRPARSSGFDPYQIPRFAAYEWGPREFSQKLSGWFAS